MKSNRITVIINKSPQEIFDFTLNPDNTPRWIDSIVKEEIDANPPKLGSIYKNANKLGLWSEYHITDFVNGTSFTMTSNDGSYHVRYTLTPKDKKATELEYFEWIDQGDLESPFTYAILEKL